MDSALATKTTIAAAAEGLDWTAPCIDLMDELTDRLVAGGWTFEDATYRADGYVMARLG